jgi:hypothetical protein
VPSVRYRGHHIPVLGDGCVLYNGAYDESCKAKSIWHGVPTALSGLPHLEEMTKSKDANHSYNPTFSKASRKES